MVWNLLRMTGAVSAITSLLIFASVFVGQMSQDLVQTANLDVENQSYMLYIEDTSHHVRLALAGHRCFEALPNWLQPDEEAQSSSVMEYSRFYLELARVEDVLARC